MKPLPSVKGLPLIGNILDFIAAGSAPKFHMYIDSRHKSLGPVFTEKLGKNNAVFIADPLAARIIFTAEGKYPRHVLPDAWNLYNKKNYCNRGLLFMDGEEWLKYRQVMNRLLLQRKISNEQVQEYVVNNFVQSLEKYSGKYIPKLEDYLYKLSISFLIGNLMGSSFMNNMEDFRKDIDILASVIHTIFSSTSKLLTLPESLLALASKFELNIWKEFSESVKSSLNAGTQLVKKMKGYPLSDGLLKDLLEENIDTDVVTGLVVDLILAAGDTTAYTTQWALYLLSKEPDVAQRVRGNSQLVNGVIKEALRLYPSAIFMSRILDNDVVLPKLEYQLTKGDVAILSMYTIGRLESAYKEPLMFLPERWTRIDNLVSGHYEGVLNPMAWIPFAMGRRSCVGRKLAEAQMYLTISKILSSYRLSLEEPVDMVMRLVPVPSKPVKIRLDKIQ